MKLGLLIKSNGLLQGGHMLRKIVLCLSTIAALSTANQALAHGEHCKEFRLWCNCSNYDLQLFKMDVETGESVFLRKIKGFETSAKCEEAVLSHPLCR